jgi:hypothetical protein
MEVFSGELLEGFYLIRTYINVPRDLPVSRWGVLACWWIGGIPSLV